MSGKHWTEPELNYLKNNKHKKNIQLPNRSKKSIRRKLVSLGLVKTYKVTSHKKQKWTAEEIKILRNAKNKNISLPNRSRDSILRKINQLNLFKKNKAKKPWPKTHTKLLIKLKKQGLSAKEITKLLPYSKNSIQKKLGYLNLTTTQTKRTIFDKETKEKFKNFLKNNWKNKSPEDLKNLWNQNYRIKVNKQKVLYYLYQLNIKAPAKEIATINYLNRKEQELIGNTLKNLEKFRTIRADIMKRRIEQNLDIWTGLPT